MSELLRIERLSKSFGRKRVLEDFGLAVESGRVYGLLGRNGEGKTTLARILMGVIPADGGVITYKGQPIGFGQSVYKREFGYVPEDPFFYEGMTVRDLLDFNARFYPKWDRKRATPTSSALPSTRRPASPRSRAARSSSWAWPWPSLPLRNS